MWYHGKIKEVVRLTNKVIAGQYERDYLLSFEQTFSKIIMLQTEYAALRHADKDMSHYRDKLVNLRMSIEMHKMMAIGFVLKLVDKIPLKLYRSNVDVVNGVSVISGFEYKDCKYKDPTRNALCQWIDNVRKQLEAK